MNSSQRQYGVWTSLAFVVGTVVGTGIYLKPAHVAKLAPELWQNLLLWTFGGVFALTGALVYARLAEVWPESGGAYVYLRRCYGEWVGSLLLAADVVLGRPAAVGALATGLGLIWGLSTRGTLLLATATLVSLALSQALGRRATGGLQMTLTALQMVPFVVIIGAGWSLARLEPEQVQAPGTALWASGFLAVLWAYDGWYNITILGGEVSRPEVNLRRALVGGVVLVTALYVGLNALLLTSVPRQEILQHGVPFVLLLRGWGLQDWGVGIQAALSLALLATLNGILACGPSMLAAGGLLKGEDQSQRRLGVLAFATWCLLLLFFFAALPSKFALFDQMSEYTACVVAGLSGLTVTCIFHLPGRGLSVGWGTRLAAVGFLALDGFMMVMLGFERPALAFYGGVSVLATGSALYLWRRRGKGTAAGNSSEAKNLQG